jgi:hypothetical protein
VELGPLGTSATEWPIVPAPGDCDDGEFGQMEIATVMLSQMIHYLIENVPGRKVNILGGHSICHSKQKLYHVDVSYSEQFPK